MMLVTRPDTNTPCVFMRSTQIKIPVCNVNNGVQLCCCFVKQENLVVNLFSWSACECTQPSSADVCFHWLGCQFLFIQPKKCCLKMEPCRFSAEMNTVCLQYKICKYTHSCGLLKKTLIAFKNKNLFDFIWFIFWSFFVPPWLSKGAFSVFSSEQSFVIVEMMPLHRLPVYSSTEAECWFNLTTNCHEPFSVHSQSCLGNRVIASLCRSLGPAGPFAVAATFIILIMMA